MIDLYPIPAFTDNYIWALFDTDGHCAVVDPGDAGPVEAFLEREGLTLRAILITHHHPDHVGGVPRLLEQHDVPVYGPAGEHIPGRTHAMEDGDAFVLDAPAMSFRVMHIPGHTLGHIAFVSEHRDPPLLFCGDTLFAAGCGKLFEGTPAQMLDSLDRLAALPGRTRVCCGHEYTLRNLQFADAVTPNDSSVSARLKEVQALRQEDRVTLPSSIDREKATNPFLRVDEATVQKAVQAHANLDTPDRTTLFAALRDWKDNF